MIILFVCMFLCLYVCNYECLFAHNSETGRAIVSKFYINCRAPRGWLEAETIGSHEYRGQIIGIFVSCCTGRRGVSGTAQTNIEQH